LLTVATTTENLGRVAKRFVVAHDLFIVLMLSPSYTKGLLHFGSNKRYLLHRRRRP
jgi:hypothetical protein